MLEGPAHRYTLPTRAVLLLAEEQSVYHVLYAEGAVASDGSSPRVDPMASVISGKKGPMPLLISEQKGFWRDFQALAGGIGTTAAATVNHAIELRMEQGDGQTLNLIAGGLLPDQAKIILWRLEERRVAPAVLRSTGMTRATEKALELAENNGKELGKALFILYTEWLKKGEGKKPDPAAVRSVRDSIQASATYWSLLEPAFWAFVQSLGDGVNPEDALIQWRFDLRKAVQTAWEQAKASLGLDSRALAAVGRSSRPIAKIFAGLSP
jgi:CRISPR type I-E-associated protein CasA/Cse1